MRGPQGPMGYNGSTGPPGLNGTRGPPGYNGTGSSSLIGCIYKKKKAPVKYGPLADVTVFLPEPKV